jgi:hypothetical protein
MPTLPGQLVNVWRPFDERQKGVSRRYQRHWSGPYKVILHNPDRPYLVQVETPDGGVARVHVNHVIPRGIQLGVDSRPWAPIAPPFKLYRARDHYEAEQEYLRSHGVRDKDLDDVNRRPYRYDSGLSEIAHHNLDAARTDKLLPVHFWEEDSSDDSDDNSPSPVNYDPQMAAMWADEANRHRIWKMVSTYHQREDTSSPFPGGPRPR